MTCFTKQRDCFFGYYLIIPLLSLISITAHASYIETTIGTAVVNDVTATYYNPAALSLLKNPQIIPIVNFARFYSQFSGRSQTVATRTTESGTSTVASNFYASSFYMGMPLNKCMMVGLAALSNFANRDPEEHSILRYTQSKNDIQDYDVVGALGVKVNKYFSLGANLSLARLALDLHRLTGFPGSNIPDSDSRNQSDGYAMGVGIGGLVSLPSSTLIGLSYRSTTKYNESGTSEFIGAMRIISRNYHFNLRTPARTTLTITQSITDTLRLMTTLQRIQWGIIRNINVFNLATRTRTTPAIVDATIPQFLKNTWALTLGTQYQILPEWIIRVAGTYNQSPHSGHFQVDNGDSYIIGASVGYTVNKTVKIDGSYAHVFMQNQTIDINGDRFLITGTNKGSRDAISLKLTVNIT